jgi:FAD/FMN-containing dehydrogenase
MSGAALARADWQGLERGIAGELILAGDERIVLANKQFARSLPLPAPQALLRCRSRDDVRRAVEFVGKESVPFAIRSGGHCFGDLSSSEGLVIDLSLMNDVTVQGDRATVGPGVLAGEASRALGAVDRAIPTGGCPLVGLGGLALAGGFGFLGRGRGLTADRVTGMDVVLGDSRIVRASAQEEPDLFWALRGGGGLGFGIVVSLTLDAHRREPMTVVNGRWRLAEAPALIEAWQAWAPGAPPAVNVELGLVSPDFPDEPAIVELFGVLGGDADEAGRHLRQVESLLGPLAAGLQGWQLSPADAADYCVGLLNHQGGAAWLPKRPYASVGYQATRSHFFDGEMKPDAVRECVRRFDEDRRYAQYRELEFVPWGGAYAHDDGTACFLHRRPRMLVRHTATAGARSTAELRAHTSAWAAGSFAALADDANGHAYQGYAEPEREDWAQLCHGHRLHRLRELQACYDPQRLFGACGRA